MLKMPVVRLTGPSRLQFDDESLQPRAGGDDQMPTQTNFVTSFAHSCGMPSFGYKSMWTSTPANCTAAWLATPLPTTRCQAMEASVAPVTRRNLLHRAAKARR